MQWDGFNGISIRVDEMSKENKGRWERGPGSAHHPKGIGLSMMGTKGFCKKCKEIKYLIYFGGYHLLACFCGFAECDHLGERMTRSDIV